GDAAATTLKPSFFKAESATHVLPDKNKKVASSGGTQDDESFRRKPASALGLSGSGSGLNEDQVHEAAVDQRVAMKSASPDAVIGSGIKGDQCGPIEYRGDVANNIKITETEWKQVMTQFHGVKGELLSWLSSHRKEFPDQTATFME